MRMVLTMALVATVAGNASADVITQWDFNGDRALKSLTNPTPSAGAGTAGLLTGNTAAWAAGSPNDAETVNDDRWNTTTYAGQGSGSGTRGVEFALSTVGYAGIAFVADIRNSNTSSAWIEVLAAYDGVNFSDSLGTFMATGGDQWNTRGVAFGAAADQNANLRVRIVAVFAPGTGSYSAANPASTYASSGTIGFDLVTFSGSAVPAPASVGVLALAGLAAGRRRR